jgi:DNA repair exonuclease SbcCD ATPase subunit
MPPEKFNWRGIMAINRSMDIKQLHKELLDNMPSGAEHDAASCPLCAEDPGEGLGDNDSLTRGGDMSTTYTKEDIDSAVAEALKPLQDRIRELEAVSEQSELQARFDQEKSELDEKIKDLQAQLDSAVLATEEAKAAHSALVAYLEDAAQKEEAAREVAERKESRLTVVREVANFPEDYVTANADRWAELADEEFEALVSDWKAISASKPKGEEAEEVIPESSALNGEREIASSGKSAVSEIVGLTGRGFDPKTL